MYSIKADALTQKILNGLSNKGVLKTYSKGLSLYQFKDSLYIDEDYTELANGNFIFVTPTERDRPILIGNFVNGSNAHLKLAMQLAKKSSVDEWVIEVAYAGEVNIEKGKIISWNNQSNSFKCSDVDKDNARLPLSMFLSWEMVQHPDSENQAPIENNFSKLGFS